MFPKFLIILMAVVFQINNSSLCAEKENPYKDGTTRVKLTATEKENLLKFINDSKYQMEKALEDASGKTFDEANRIYHETILKVVMESFKFKKRAELLMRYALNQALELTYGEPTVDGKGLKKEGVLKHIANKDLLTVVLEDSIKLAIKYYEKDKIAVEEMSLVNLPFIEFSYVRLLRAKEWLSSIFNYNSLLSFEITILEQWLLTVKNEQTLEEASLGKLIYEVDDALGRVEIESHTVLRKCEYLKGVIFKILKELRKENKPLGDKQITNHQSNVEMINPKDKISFLGCLSAAASMNSLSSADSMRFTCFEKFKDKISFEVCTKSAYEMSSAGKKDNMRYLCLDYYKKKIFFQDCSRIASEMSLSSNADSVRFSCFDDFREKISFKECNEKANQMSTDGKKDNLRYKCFEKFKEEITFFQCDEMAEAMNNSSSGDDMRYRCFENYKDEISFKQCAVMAGEMSSSGRQDDLLRKCTLNYL